LHVGVWWPLAPSRAGRCNPRPKAKNSSFSAPSRALHDIGFQGDAVIELAHEKGFQPTRPLRETWKLNRNFVKHVLGY
jgi:hypothetical protein